jgi:hypothetical protein
MSALGLLGAPLIAMRCSTIAPEHFATIGKIETSSIVSTTRHAQLLL